MIESIRLVDVDDEVCLIDLSKGCVHKTPRDQKTKHLYTRTTTVVLELKVPVVSCLPQRDAS